MTNSTLDLTGQLFEMPDGRRVGHSALKHLLPDIETALFFGKVYKLDARKLGELLRLLFNSTLIQALLGEGAMHSSTLQEYVIDVLPDAVEWGVSFADDLTPPDGELLTVLWEDAMVEVADSIQEVADKLGDTLDHLPSKYGSMMFKTLNKLARNRPTVGTYEAAIYHQNQPKVLVILDVSGSMSEPTIRAIVDDVVALSYQANAYLAIVSNTATIWEPGTFAVEDVLCEAEYGGTHYEMLLPLFDEDWGTVVTIADYDSWGGNANLFAKKKGRVGQVLDLSLVSRSTFLAECIGPLADKVRPLLIASRDLC